MWIEVLSKYWSQIAVILAAIGYILKVFFDYRIKKREIIYSYFASEKIKAIDNYLEECSSMALCLNRANSALGINIPGNKERFESEIHDKFELYSKAYAKLWLFFDDSDIEQCKEITRNFYKASVDYFRAQHNKTKYTEDLGNLLEENNTLTKTFTKKLRAQIIR